MSDENDRKDSGAGEGETRVLDAEEGATTVVPPGEVAEAAAGGAGGTGTGAEAGARTTAFQPDLTGSPAEGEPPSLLDQIELPLEVRLGRLAWPLERVLSLRVGDAVPVGPDGDDVVTLYVQGRPYATGELVVLEGRFGFRVRELVTEGGP